MPISLQPGASLIYPLPSIIDPDGDNFKVNVDLNEASVIGFISNNALNFNIPDDFSGFSKSIKIEITLTDNNAAYPKSMTYQLTLDVEVTKKSNVTTTPPKEEQ